MVVVVVVVVFVELSALDVFVLVVLIVDCLVLLADEVVVVVLLLLTEEVLCALLLLLLLFAINSIEMASKCWQLLISFWKRSMFFLNFSSSLMMDFILSMSWFIFELLLPSVASELEEEVFSVELRPTKSMIGREEALRLVVSVGRVVLVNASDKSFSTFNYIWFELIYFSFELDSNALKKEVLIFFKLNLERLRSE